MPFTYLWVQTTSLLIIIRFIHGLATAIYGPVSMAVVADVAGAKKGEMLSWFSSITIIGNLLGAPLGGFILHQCSRGRRARRSTEFHYAYLLSGIAGMMALLLSLGLLKDGKSDR